MDILIKVKSGFIVNSNMKTFALLLVIASFFLVGFSHEKTTDKKLMKEAQTALAAADYEKAFSLYSLAVKKEKNHLAEFTLGLFYRNGWGRPIDDAAACQWFEKSAAGGIPVGQHFTGLCLVKGVHRSADPAAAAVWFQKAAKAGHDQSLCNLGNLSMTGNGVPKDPKKALELCYRPAEQGVVPAQVWMGKFFLEGDESIRDVKQAYAWFDAAAQKNEPEALYYSGVIVGRGLFEGHTPLEARKLFEQAASLWYVPAYFPTGKLHFNAEPDPETKALSPEDLALAYLWLTATVKRSTNPAELNESKKMLDQIRAVMPATWLPELDRKVAKHLENH
jgi:TPR repeat protein